MPYIPPIPTSIEVLRDVATSLYIESSLAEYDANAIIIYGDNYAYVLSLVAGSQEFHHLFHGEFTFDEIAYLLHISKGRVQQLERTGTHKLFSTKDLGSFKTLREKLNMFKHLRSEIECRYTKNRSKSDPLYR